MPITRTRVLLRAKYGWARKTVTFDQNTFHQPDGYRTNAPGFVSMCWDIPLNAPRSMGGMNTVSLLSEGWCKEIKVPDLLPGDAIGYLGPQSDDGDGGFIVIFEKWLDDNPSLGVALTWDLHRGVSPGPDQRGRSRDLRWHAYRRTDIIDE